MPMYEYQCNECGFQKVYIKRIQEANLQIFCPEKNCTGEMIKMISLPSQPHFKGLGFYATDSKRKERKKDAAKEHIKVHNKDGLAPK